LGHGADVSLVTEEALDVVRVLVGPDAVGDSSEDENLLHRFVVGDNRHALVAHEVNPFGCDGVLYLQPEFLVEQEQVDVIEEGRGILFAHLVVATTHDNQTVVSGQVFHGVAEAGHRCLSTHLNRGELTVDDFLVDGVGLEEAQAVLGLTLLILTAKEVNPLYDGIGLDKKDVMSNGYDLLCARLF
jgi:hypothetical protein